MGLKPLFKGYVSPKGIFNKNIKGSYGFYSGTFEDVISVSRLRKKDLDRDDNMEQLLNA